MWKYIIIAIVIWEICKLFQSSAQTANFDEAMKKFRKDQERIDRQVQQAYQANERLFRQQAQEERARLAAEERLEKEQERQAKIIAKHEKDIRVLKQSVVRMKNQYADLELRLETLFEIKDMIMADFLKADHAGDSAKKEKAMRKLVAIDKQISTARDRKDAIADKIENAEIELAS